MLPAVLGTREAEVLDSWGEPYSGLLISEVDIFPGDELGLRPTLLKIDVEGGEVSVLRGFSETVDRWSPMVILEIAHGAGDALSWLEEHDYTAMEFVLGHLRKREGSRFPETLNVVAVRDRSPIAGWVQELVLS